MKTATEASPVMVSSQFQSSLCIQTLNRVLGAVSVFVSGLLAFYLLFSFDTLGNFEKRTLIFRLQILVEACCWAVAAAFAFVTAKVNNERIQMSFGTFPPDSTVEGISLRSQALVPMAVCTVCYALRSLFLLCRLVGESPLFVATTRFHPVWWIAFVWAPTLLVVLMALYSARRRDRNVLLDRDSDPTNPDNYAPLLPSVPPPQEAFRNFRLFADGIVSPFGPSPAKESQQSVGPQHINSSMEISGNLGDTTEI